MRNPYAQVALTYLRRPLATWQGRVFCLITLVMCLPAVALPFSGQNDFTVLLFGPFIFLFLYLAVHVKDQFADSRARLTPGFRRAHVAIAAAASLIAAVLLPATLAWLAGWHSLGLVACAVLLFGAAIWQMSSPWLGLLVAVGFLAMMNRPLSVYLHQLVSGQAEPAAVGILAFGVLATLLGAIRLIRLYEEMPEYHRRMQWDWSERARASREGWSRQARLLPWLWDWLADRQITLLARHAQRASQSRWSAVCRWRAGMYTGWSIWVWALVTAAFLYCLIWLLPKPVAHGPRPPAMNETPLGMIAFIVAMQPMALLFASLMKRMPILGHELMMPVGRSAYVKELGLAVALGQLQLWAGMCVGMAPCWLILVRPLQLDVFTNVVLISGAVQVLVFGIVAWVASYRQHQAALVFFLIVPASMSVMGVSTPLPLLDYRTLLAVAIPVGLGLLLSHVAYRRWLVTDFD